jgi:hypothetical protein
MVVERRFYKQENPVLYTGTEYRFFKIEYDDVTYYEVESLVIRGASMADRYKETYRQLPEHLQSLWDKGLSY